MSRNLNHREFVRLGEAVKLFGRSREFWRDHFDSGHIDGYRDTAGRHLRVTSCRDYLDLLCNRTGNRPRNPDGSVNLSAIVSRKRAHARGGSQ